MDYSAMDFKTAIEFLVTALTGLGIVGAARWIHGRIWARSLVAFRVRLPADVGIDAVARTLAVVAGSTRRRPIVFETVGTHRGISHFLLVGEPMAPGVVTTVTATLPGVRLEEAEGYLSTRPQVRLARELGVARTWRPLATDRAAHAAAGVLTALYPLNPGELVRVQWTLRARGYVRPVGDLPPEMVRDFQLKQSAPLVDACGRVAVTAPHRKRAGLLMWRVLSGLKALDAPGAAFSTRLTPTRVVARRVRVRAVPLLPWPCVFNTGEAAALLAYPTDGLTVPGLTTGSARPLPVPADMGGSGLVVGESNYPGMAGRPLSLDTGDRLRHVSVHGPTGAGKSELMANMICQDIEAGHGVVVIDPKSDLVSQVLARIPEHRTDDVIVMDASATKNPIGFNPLFSGAGDHARELSVDRMVYVMSNLWRNSWGPRTADVLRNALLTLTHARAEDGSRFTMVEIPALLADSDFRRSVLGSSRNIPQPVREFWSFYDQLNEHERSQLVGPAMNKLRAFTTRTALRLVLGQSEGIDLGAVLRERKILLVPLAKGVIGPDAANLLGSLLVAMLWQETLNRATVAEDKRSPAFAYIDEFQEFLKFGAGGDIAEMLAQARSFGLGVVLAHQYLDQLPHDVAAAVLGTVRSQIVFQLEYSDAREMAHRFAPLETADLSGLDTYEIAMRPCVNSRTLSPVTGRTLQLPEPIRAPADLKRDSLAQHGTARAEIEDACLRRTILALPTRPASHNNSRQRMPKEGS
ncbi:type IV secretory system conjugative DNA transfer family protein [Spirillospora sp. CA-108201]